jgi:hypothetical protein
MRGVTVTMAAGAAILMLAGCQKAGPTPAKPKAGQWEVTQTITAVGVPGDAKPRSSTNKTCLKDSDLNFTELSQSANGLCKSSEVSSAPGVVHAKVVCNAGQPNAGEAVVDGKTTVDTLHIEVTSKESRPVPGGALPMEMRMKITMDGKRIGDCPTS